MTTYNAAGTAYNDNRYNYDGTLQVPPPPVAPPPSSSVSVKRVSPTMPDPVLDNRGRPT